MTPSAIWWIRRDLRLHDNPALQAALEGGRTAIPVFVLDDRLLRAPTASPRREAFLFDGLAALDASLQERGSRLIVRRGRPEEELARLVRETAAEEVVAEVDHTPFSRRRDSAVAADLPLRWVTGQTIHPPDLIHKPDGAPYAVYGAFRRAWNALPPPSRRGLLHRPQHLPPIPSIESLPLPEARPAAGFPAGEDQALLRLKQFARKAMSEYSLGRDLLDREGTSRLSPYLRFGMLSARAAAVEASEAAAGADSPDHRRGAEVWLNELIWREFYIMVLHHHPRVLRRAFRSNLRGIRWQDNPERFQAWASGQTGYPVVDAAMRQLALSGWMPNRARMIVASFLTKDLLIDWRQGEQWFLQHLIDGDRAANNGGWQWTAGVGTDAAPYFRIFNPVLQGRKFDPHGDYVRRWVPELETVPERYVHEPWRMSEGLRASTGLRLGRDYPAPVVDHREQRQRALALYASARGSA